MIWLLLPRIVALLVLRQSAIVILLFGTIVAVDQFSAWLRRHLVGSDAFLPALRGS